MNQNIYFPIAIGIIVTILEIVVLIILYKKRNEDEINLGWKLFGYSYLGAGFSIGTTHFSIPFGIIIALFFYRPQTNKTPKRYAAFVGFAFMLFSKFLHHFPQFYSPMIRLF
jgi:hypothetical protein